MTNYNYSFSEGAIHVTNDFAIFSTHPRNRCAERYIEDAIDLGYTQEEFNEGRTHIDNLKKAIKKNGYVPNILVCFEMNGTLYLRDNNHLVKAVAELVEEKDVVVDGVKASYIVINEFDEYYTEDDFVNELISLNIHSTKSWTTVNKVECLSKKNNIHENIKNNCDKLSYLIRTYAGTNKYLTDTWVIQITIAQDATKKEAFNRYINNKDTVLYEYAEECIKGYSSVCEKYAEIVEHKKIKFRGQYSCTAFTNVFKELAKTGQQELLAKAFISVFNSKNSHLIVKEWPKRIENVYTIFLDILNCKTHKGCTDSEINIVKTCIFALRKNIEESNYFNKNAA